MSDFKIGFTFFGLVSFLALIPTMAWFVILSVVAWGLNQSGLTGDWLHYWNRKVIKQVVDKKTNVVKDKETIQKVKITVLTQDQDPTEVSNKGKFSFRNACGNRIYISVKSYKEADDFVAEFYSKGVYRVSSVHN